MSGPKLTTFICTICGHEFQAVYVNHHEGWRAKSLLCVHARIDPEISWGITFHEPFEGDTPAPANPNQLFKRRHHV